jgi:hypothetical protein
VPTEALPSCIPQMNTEEPNRRTAKRDLDEARRDPRLAVGREAMVRDWWAAMKAAERTRRLFEWGAQHSRSSARLDPYGDDAQASSAFQERQALAQAELDSELAEISAMTLVASHTRWLTSSLRHCQSFRSSQEAVEPVAGRKS